MTHTAPTTLLLWDIDLTLVDYSGTGRAWYGRALSRVLGIELAHLPVFPGRTERSIAVEMLEAHGVEWTEDHVERIFAELVAVATAARPDLPTLGRALPGAAEILAAVATRPAVVQSLVTGNLPEVADCKLAPFGLDRHLDLEIGGYGSLSIDRHELVAAATQAAERKYRTRFPPESVVVVGDTPHDIAAARHLGAVGVGVATGRHSMAELAASGARVVLPDLSDTAAALDAILGCAGSSDKVKQDQLPSGA
ncbi:HAD family hydrolase [Actinokineospora iranica]|uniref:Phosphoglycolate phosphatase, HAD superfamily n=1 Tax=Actinokineospora iranica TaxID=1271860 RepID=A0A1G6KME5_9PSEU|nr:haloacid dehalogenase-like hydrolase [Actinokineospora iranica]SDC32087.1 Phosphoglycolate phosphatase, HAD superfamily [Actinokineospora iranica]